LVQVAEAATPSTFRFERETSSPKARGRTDRLIELMPAPVMFRIAIFWAVEIVPLA
jgi:hypothetical protein